jgi:hypothetical protein
LEAALRPYLTALIIGLCTGFLQALLGIGGGSILVPALVLLAGMKQKEAQALSLWYVVPTSLTAGIAYIVSGTAEIRLSFVLAMLIAALVGAAIGVRFVKRIDGRALKQVFGMVLIVLAGVMIISTLVAAPPRPGSGAPGEKGSSETTVPGATAQPVGGGVVVSTPTGPRPTTAPPGPPERDLQGHVVAASTGLLAGFLGSLMGIGGGVVVVPSLRVVGGFAQKVAQGMSLLYVVPAALYSAILYRVHAKIRVDARIAAALIAGGLAGAFGGTFFVKGIRDTVLTWIFAAALALVGIIIALRARRERLSAPADNTEEPTE